jgi:hypothetical protein
MGWGVRCSRVQSQGLDAGFKDEEDDDNVYTKSFHREAPGVRAAAARGRVRRSLL